MPIDWITLLVSAVMSGLAGELIEKALGEVRVPKDGISKDLEKVLKRSFESFEQVVKTMLAMDGPSRLNLRELAQEEGFVRSAAQLPFRRSDKIDAAPAREAFRIHGPPDAADLHFDAAWATMGSRFKAEIARDEFSELRHYIELVQQELSDERVEEIALNVASMTHTSRAQLAELREQTQLIHLFLLKPVVI